MKFRDGIYILLMFVTSCSGKKDEKNNLTIKNLTKNCDGVSILLESSSAEPKLQSTDLPVGEYEYLSGEVYIETPQKLKIHVVEKMTGDKKKSDVGRKVETMCSESLDQASENLKLKISAPRLIGVQENEKKVNAAFRELTLTAPSSSIYYEYSDLSPKMGMTRLEFQNYFKESFEESYFIKKSLESYVFIGKRKLKDGTKLTIKMSYKKTGGNVEREALKPQPMPTNVFNK